MELRYLIENFNLDGTIVIKEWSDEQSRYIVTQEWENMSLIKQNVYKDREVLYIYAEDYCGMPALIIELATK